MYKALAFLILLGLIASPALAERPPSCTASDPTVATDLARFGWSAQGLEEVRAAAREFNNDALMIVTNNQVVFRDGPIDKPIWIASMRKSVLSLLIGRAVAEGKIKLDTTIGQMGFDQKPPLTETETTATIRDLIMSRSGVYLPTAAETGFQKKYRPERGADKPGARWFYNNWDFNVAGAAFEKLSGEGIFDAVDSGLAKPLCMQDWRGPKRDGSYLRNKEAPEFRAYHMRFSTRDFARIGQMMLQQGQFAGTQVVPEDWIQESTAPLSDTSIGSPPGFYGGTNGGYGYMWWVAAKTASGEVPAIPVGSYMAAGAGGQRLTVIPAISTVIVWRSERRSKNPSVLDNPGQLGQPSPADQLFAKIMAARLPARQ